MKREKSTVANKVAEGVDFYRVPRKGWCQAPFYRLSNLIFEIKLATRRAQIVFWIFLKARINRILFAPGPFLLFKYLIF